MATARVKEKLDIPADRVWDLISDFGNTSWFPGTKAEVKGEGPGMVRYMGAGDGPPIHEELVSIDPSKRTLTYIITENIPFPVTGYRATMTVTEAGGGASELEWSCTFEPAGVSDAEAIGMLEGMYKTMIGWLRDALS